MQELKRKHKRDYSENIVNIYIKEVINMPCGCTDNKKLNLEDMEKMSIENIVKLYQDGYTLEDARNYDQLQLQETSLPIQSMAYYTLTIRVIEGYGDVYIYRNGELVQIASRGLQRMFTDVSAGESFSITAQPWYAPGFDTNTGNKQKFQKYIIDDVTPSTGNTLAFTMGYANKTIDAYFCPPIFVSMNPSSPIVGNPITFSVAIAETGSYNIDILDSSNNIKASCVISNSAMCTTSAWTPAAGTYNNMKARMLNRGCESNAFNVIVSETPPPPPGGCPTTISTTSPTPSSPIVNQPVYLGVGILPAGYYHVEFVVAAGSPVPTGTILGTCTVGSSSYNSSSCVSNWTPTIAGTYNYYARIVGTTCVGNTRAITVSAPPPTPTLNSVELSSTIASIAIGGTKSFTAVAKDTSGNSIPGATIVWGISDVAKAFISPTTGSSTTVTGVATTTTVVTLTATATYGGVNRQATASITVTGITLVLTTVEITPINVTVAPGSTKQFTAIPKDQNGSPMSGVTVTWSSSNVAIATVSPATGLTTTLIGVVEGGPITLTATATKDAVTKTATSSVTISSVPVQAGGGGAIVIAAVALVAAMMFMRKKPPTSPT